MGLNPSKGNMYPFVTHTWNTVKGKCPHDCSYCYMKRSKQNPVRFDKKELRTPLFDTETGEDELFIFVGSSCDMFADDIPYDWILKTMYHCRAFDNKYLFQSKNPSAFATPGIQAIFPPNIILGTTIETNRIYEQMGKAPGPHLRSDYMRTLAEKFKTMVTIEPIMDFDLGEILSLIGECLPQWVNIGADSQRHNLPEPPPEKIRELILELERFTEVKVKKNLQRTFKGGARQ